MKNFMTSLFFVVCFMSSSIYAKNPKVVMKTNQGEIHLELFQDKAPISVKNFLNYAKSNFYNGTIFHRVIDNFMIQGGGFTKEMIKKETNGPIKNEAHNGLKNEVGTISYARTSLVNSATSQFFINVNDNSFLDHKNKTERGYGYAVFGKVVKGMSVVKRIKSVKTQNKGMYQNVPSSDIIIESVKILK